LAIAVTGLLVTGCGAAHPGRQGPPAEQPSTAEVEGSRRHEAEDEQLRRRSLLFRARGRLIAVGCREKRRGVWLCTLRFDSGRIVVERAAWYQRADTEGVSIVSERG
jgi:hypothetical protein